MSNFKIALTTIFGICIVAGIAIFALSKSSTTTQTAHLNVWGILPQQVFTKMYKASSVAGNKQITVTYTQKSPATFDSDLVNALADGVGPDVVIMRDDSIYKNRNKLFTIPYDSYNQRTFKDTFIEAGEIFLTPNGITAFPLTIDPLVLYWNRDTFSTNLTAQPPKYWDEFYKLIQLMTKKDSNANISDSAVALGEWRNITNAKEIISLLLLQAGASITSNTSNLGIVASLNSGDTNQVLSPGESAINFYTQFSNPTSPNYTWNRSLPASQTFFLSGSLATYIGFASEISSIQEKNPNLNFDVTTVPQIRESKKKINFGRMYATAIVKQSKQVGSAFLLAVALTENSAEKAMEAEIPLSPVRRDILSSAPSTTGGNAYKTVFYNSAIVSKSWIDPDPSLSSATFRDMIESITSGRARVSEAVNQASGELDAELQKYK